MPGDPEQCRLNAVRCLKLSQRAKDPTRRHILAALAETWRKLAAELESDQRLLNALSELEFGEAFYAVPEALNLRQHTRTLGP
jgi:hypothetical protein